MEGGEAERVCVVTGGRGFAARHLVEMLLRSPKWSVVRIADLGPSIRLDPVEEEAPLGGAIRSGRAIYVSADLCDKSQVVKACQGADAVFHMAAPNSSINNFKLHYSVNVEGTKNIIDACIECKVKRLIYTSSCSVVFDGVHGIYNADESMSYPDKYNDSYSETKAAAEALVIKANGVNGLLTCCIRPSSIFGPGDKLLAPSLVTAARAGKSKFIVGDGNNMYDFTYVENVAHGHICAEQALASGGVVAERAAGQAYFITNMEPIKFWEFMSRILEGLGYQRPGTKIPAAVVMPIAHVVELIYRILGPWGMSVPQLTPSRIRLLSCNRTFSSLKARDQIGYTPIVSLEDGLRRTIESYSHLHAEQQIERSLRSDRPSKIYLYMGSGNVADVLLWKEKTKTIIILLLSILVYQYFFVYDYTFITTVMRFLLAVTLILFIHGFLPMQLFGYKIEKIPPSYFHFTEEMSHRVVLSVGSSWNSSMDVLKTLCKGKDWSLFLKVILGLVFLNIIGAISLQNLFRIGVPFLFIAFYVYDRKEAEIDDMFHRALSSAMRIKSDATHRLSTYRQSIANRQSFNFQLTTEKC